MMTWIKGHKKITATIIAALAQVLAAFFPDYSASIDNITQAIMVYVGAQGVADFGKGAKKAEAGK